MPDYNVISDVSLTLQSVLTDALQSLDPASPPVAEIHDLQGQISTAPARITIFLFETVEDPSARNRPRVMSTNAPNLNLKKPPMALLLRYMLTPWSGDRVTDYKMLGRALQTFYDGAILHGTQLQGGLAGTDQALKVTLSPLPLEERARVWYAIQRPYRLSITYEVRVVNLDAEMVKQVSPVAQRTIQPSKSESTA